MQYRMPLRVLLTLTVAAIAPGVCSGDEEVSATVETESVIVNNTDWMDTAGNPIEAHDGGISQFDDVFYWYGTSYASNPKGSYGHAEDPWDGFRVYSSTDLVNWTCEGWALPRPESGLCSTHTSHRAHVIYNQSTRKYVMWFFWYVEDYPNVPLMVAVSDSPTGPFEILGIRETGGPTGHGQDMNLFKDDDGCAYLIYDDGTRSIRIDRLSDDYLSSTKESIVALQPTHEAPAMVKYRGKYIVAGSGVRGWSGTDTHYAVASAPMGPYGAKKRMSDRNTWSSQITSFVHVQDSDVLFAMCDAWWNPDPADLNKSRYFWIPVVFDPDKETAVMLYHRKWNPFSPAAHRD